jgi:hypothetical protein
VLARHDFLSAGMGALAVTGYCVMKGQDLGTALWITAAATVGELHAAEQQHGMLQCRTQAVTAPRSSPALCWFSNQQSNARLLLPLIPSPFLSALLLPFVVAIVVEDMLPKNQ